MKQIIAVIKDFSTNIESIKSKIKELNAEVEKVCFGASGEPNAEQIAANKNFQKSRDEI